MDDRKHTWREEVRSEKESDRKCTQMCVCVCERDWTVSECVTDR